MSIKELRKSLELTQKEASKIVNVPLRTYVNYENDISKEDTIKYIYIKEKLEEYGFIDETHGILTIEKIKDISKDVFDNFDVEYCYLFGSYAKGIATEVSDIDLLISTKTSGLEFYGLVEMLRESLKKKVEVLSFSTLKNDTDILNEILRDGIKIYGQ